MGNSSVSSFTCCKKSCPKSSSDLHHFCEGPKFFQRTRLCTKISTKDLYMNLSRSRSHIWSTNPRNKFRAKTPKTNTQKQRKETRQKLPETLKLWSGPYSLQLPEALQLQSGDSATSSKQPNTSAKSTQDSHHLISWFTQHIEEKVW
jgi:hypothetical protein